MTETRAAVVVIHGIGEQPPLATLGRFAQGIVDHAGGGQPEAVLRQVAGEPQPVVRFRDLGGYGTVDVLEFAWQHLVLGRISGPRTVWWLLGTTLAPLDFRRHWRLLAAAGAEAPSPWLVVCRQLLLAAALLLPVVLVPGLFVLAAVNLLGQPLTAWPPAPQLSAGPWVWLAISASFVLLALLQVGAVLKDAVKAARINRRSRSLHGRDWFGLHGSQARRWRLPAAVFSLLALLLGVLAGWQATAAWSQLWQWLSGAAGRPWLISMLLTVAGFATLAHFLRFLRDYAGDIALYVTADWQPAANRSRHLIKESAARLISALLRDPAYDRVVIVGHSLGSVIAFDALNVLSRESRLENLQPAAPLGKLHGLLTLGSPLDKVAYFFREHTADDAAIHAQLLSFLHPTRRLPSRRDDGPYGLADYSVPLENLQWINLHAPLDVISDPLIFYRTSELLSRPYLPAGAHRRYWSDPLSYAQLLRLLKAETGSP